MLGATSDPVTFYDDSNAIGSTALSSTGVASVSTSSLAVGTHAITVVLSATPTHTAATSGPMSEVIVQPDFLFSGASATLRTWGSGTSIRGRSAWGAIADQYFFVLFSFVVMGAISIFEWEMLFPDRVDFLILSPLPLRPSRMLAAEVVALMEFMSLFLVSCNLFGVIILPAVSRGDFFRQLDAHGIAVLLAGIFAVLFFLAMGGVLLCVLDAARFRLVSPLLQMVSVTLLALLLLQYAMLGESIQALLVEPLGMARWSPPLWFLGVYERLLYREAAPAFAQDLSRYACGMLSVELRRRRLRC
jgi:hypothetical protein